MGDAILLDGILDSLEDMGCKGALMEDGALMTVVEAGITSQLFTSLVVSLCAELKQTLSLQEAVTPPQGVGPRDMECFQLELHGFLKELQCPHVSLTEGVFGGMSTSHQCLLLLDYLVSEVMTSRLVLTQQDEDAAMDTTTGEQSRTIGANLAAILKMYDFSRPPPNVTIRQVYQKIIGMTKGLLEETPLAVGLVTQKLSDSQWEVMEEINKSLTQEYSTRRQMLLTRCDVTIQSFGWSEKVKGAGGGDQISKAYRGRREGLNVCAPVSMARVLAAKDDLLSIRKTNDPSVRSHTQCSINKVLIQSKVPDRGGRPRETRPPSEMPAFKKRTEAPRDQRQKGGGAKGGRVQGGWSGGKGGGKKSGGKGRWSQSSHTGHQGYQGGTSKQYHS